MEDGTWNNKRKKTLLSWLTQYPSIPVLWHKNQNHLSPKKKDQKSPSIVPVITGPAAIQLALARDRRLICAAACRYNYSAGRRGPILRFAPLIFRGLPAAPGWLPRSARPRNEQIARNYADKFAPTGDLRRALNLVLRRGAPFFSAAIARREC